jgi:hypothetical protein
MNSKLFRYAVYFAFTVATLLSVARVVRTYDDPRVEDDSAQGLIDFHNAVYYPALACRQGLNPYSAEYAAQFPVNRQYPLYSPATLWMNVPFTLLPLPAADVAYFIYSFALVLALAVSVLHICSVRLNHVHILALATLILGSRPGHINLMLGQSTLPMILGALWAMQLAQRRPTLAAFALALTTLKPTFGVPLVWLLFCRRDYKAVFLGVAIGGAAAVLGAAPIVARDGLAEFIASLRASQSLHDGDPVIMASTSWTRLDALSVLGRFTESNPAGASEALIAAAVLLTAGLAVYRTSGTSAGEGADSLSALVISAATLLCIYHSMYDALLLVCPWLGLMVGRLRTQVPAWSIPILWLLVALPAANYISTRSVIERLGLEGLTWTVVASANGLALLAVFALSAGIALVRPQSFSTALSPAPAPGSIAG